METRTFTVPNITCHHCTNTIQNELSELSGISTVKADPGTKKVTVTWQAPASLEKILATLREINYPAAES
jgi:copper chaperone CopZ